MGLLFILLENNITNMELVRLDLLVECSFKMFLINLMMLNYVYAYFSLDMIR